MGRTVLIDADITAFQIASSQEKVFEFNGEHVLHADLNKGCEEVEKAIAYITKRVDADQAVLFLTGEGNFRKDVLPTYKGNRTGVRRPMILTGLRQFIRDHFKTVEENGLEADDLLGIHSTMPHKGERVIYSADKDLRTVPALHWDNDDGEIIEVSQQEGDRFFHQQILTGDPTDNYVGCPGVGPAGAAELLDGKVKWVKDVSEFKSGPRKGQEKITWRKAPLAYDEDFWTSIVSAYLKVGLKPKDALIQARCARILRHGEYDFKQQKVHLWTPN